MWSDIDYLDDFKIFTISEAYSKLPEYVKEIKKNGVRFVPILDPGVAKRSNSSYKAYDDGVA
jgi:alpha-glucosidase (family GH31 glycosyl hydrolase)